MLARSAGPAPGEPAEEPPQVPFSSSHSVKASAGYPSSVS